MKKLKEWVMAYIVKKLIGEWIGRLIAKADGKRTWIGIAILVVLTLAKYLIPVFVPGISPDVMEALDGLIFIVVGSTGSFAGVKAQKVWDAIKKAGDDVVKP